LGNPFILYNESKKREEMSGNISNFTMRMLELFPDNGQNILVLIPYNKTQVKSNITIYVSNIKDYNTY
jgi:hypothetical protein